MNQRKLPNRVKFGLAALLALVFLAASWWRAPYFFKSRTVADEIQTPAQSPVFLFRANNVRVFYTSENLLYPQSFADAGTFFEEVVFDIWPGGEGHSLRTSSLTWILEISRYLSAEARVHTNAEQSEASDVDARVLNEFIRQYGGKATLERGKLSVFTIAPDSGYRKKSGITTIVAIAVKDPGNNLHEMFRGKPQLFDMGLRTALQQAAKRDCRGVGVPYMPVSEPLGSPLAKVESWRRTLEIIKSQSEAESPRNIVLGGFGLTQTNRQLNDREFLQAWRAWRSSLSDDDRTMVHETTRLTAVVWFASMIALALSRRRFLPRRVLAIGLLSASLAGSVTVLSGWFLPLTAAIAAPHVQLPLKIGLAFLSGLCLERIVKFEPAKEI